MMKQILVLMGETPASQTARDYACQLGRTVGAGLTGIAGVDLAYIEAPMAGGIGTMAYKRELERTLKSQAASLQAQLRESFETECRARGVGFSWLAFEGEPVPMLSEAAETRDLVVTGYDTAFRGGIRENHSETLSELCRLMPRPVVIAPDSPSRHADILVAYDGSAASMRALQMFVLLGIGRGRRVHVVAIDYDETRAARRAAAAATYLKVHDFETVATPIASYGVPAEILRRQVVERNIGLLVMGAYGNRGLADFLFGSTSTALTEAPPCMLFLYH